MREFFRGWKRKLGVVALGLACVFAAVWVRARTARDWISVPMDTAGYFFQIDNRGISLSKNKNLVHLWYFSERHIDWRISEPIRPSNSDSLTAENDQTETLRHWWGLKEIRLRYMTNGYQEKVLWWRSAKWTIPHWLIVLPLLLLSAYLLLSKPKTTVNPEAAEKQPNA
jgi:hypothetical protein